MQTVHGKSQDAGADQIQVTLLTTRWSQWPAHSHSVQTFWFGLAIRQAGYRLKKSPTYSDELYKLTEEHQWEHLQTWKIIEHHLLKISKRWQRS